MTFYLQTYLCLSYSSLQEEAGATVKIIKFKRGAKVKRRKKKKQISMKIGQSKFTERGNQLEKVFQLRFQFRFQSLNGCTDNGLATAASFGALIIKRHMYVHQYHFRNLQ